MKDRIGVAGRNEKYWFDPQEDISTYELSLCMDFLLRGALRSLDNGEWGNLPNEAKRHFEITLCKSVESKSFWGDSFDEVKRSLRWTFRVLGLSQKNIP